MASWIWVLIPLVALIGGFIIEYQKNKIKMMNRSRQNEEVVDDLRELVNSLQRRIEHLEAIAAGDPDHFAAGLNAESDDNPTGIESTIKQENQREVSEIAKTRLKG